MSKALATRSFPGDWTESMAALKGLVIFMAVLIVVGMAAIAYGLYQKATNPDFRLFSEGSGATDAANPPTAFGDVAIRLPGTCEVVDIRPDGARLYLHVDCAEEPHQRVAVIDVTSGTLLGTIAVTP